MAWKVAIERSLPFTIRHNAKREGGRQAQDEDGLDQRRGTPRAASFTQARNIAPASLLSGWLVA